MVGKDRDGSMAGWDLLLGGLYDWFKSITGWGVCVCGWVGKGIWMVHVAEWYI